MAEVKIGQDTFPLEYDFSVIEWFESKSGLDFIPAISSHLGARTIIWLLLAGIRTAEPKMTYDQLRDKVNAHVRNGGTLGQLTKGLFEGLRQYGMIAPKEEDDEGAFKRPSGDGPGGS